MVPPYPCSPGSCGRFGVLIGASVSGTDVVPVRCRGYTSPSRFPDLAQTTDEDELAAIEAGEIRATRVDYHGSLS